MSSLSEARAGQSTALVATVRVAAARALVLIGDLGVASLFWVSAFGDLLPHWPAAVGYVGRHGMPVPALVAGAALLFEIVAPAFLFWPRTSALAALALAAYCLATALIFHAFWREAPGFAHDDALFHFFKNIALAGALLCRTQRRTISRSIHWRGSAPQVSPE